MRIFGNSLVIPLGRCNPASRRLPACLPASQVADAKAAAATAKELDEAGVDGFVYVVLADEAAAARAAAAAGGAPQA